LKEKEAEKLHRALKVKTTGLNLIMRRTSLSTDEKQLKKTS